MVRTIMLILQGQWLHYWAGQIFFIKIKQVKEGKLY